MTLKTRRRLIWLANGVLATALACAGALASWPLAGLGARNAPSLPQTPSGPREVIEPLAAYLPSAKVELRRPLVDPPRVAPPEPKAAVLPFRLIGLAAEKGHGQAVFRSPSGEVKVLAVGEIHAGMKVVAIEESGVTVEFGGRALTLKKEGPP